MEFASRNTSLGFAQRTLANLKFIDGKRAEGEPVHLVTQTVLSLVGLVVFPWEEGLDKALQKRSYAELIEVGWPEWDISLGTANTLGELLRHVRNALSHRRLKFSSDSLDSEQVEIQFEDAKSSTATVYWRATIAASNLHGFCIKFTDLVHDRLS